MKACRLLRGRRDSERSFRRLSGARADGVRFKTWGISLEARTLRDTSLKIGIMRRMWLMENTGFSILRCFR